MKNLNNLTSGKIELPGEENVLDYSVKPGVIEEAKKEIKELLKGFENIEKII